MVQNAKFAVGCHAANFYGVQPPFVKNFEHFMLAATLGYQQHALLRLTQHDLVWSHSRFALWHTREINFDSHAASRRHFRARTRKPRGAHVLNRDYCSGAHSFQTSFEQQFFQKGVADLYVWTFLLRFLAELRGSQ